MQQLKIMEIKCNIIGRKRSRSCLILWVCLLVYPSTPEVTTAHVAIGCTNCASNKNQTVDYTLRSRDDPCSSDFLRANVHGVLPVVETCEASAPVTDQITNTIVRLVPKLNLHEYLVIICPAGIGLSCLYAIHIVERRDNMIVSNSELTRASVAALQSIFTTAEILESKTGFEGSRIVREFDAESGSGSGMSPPMDSSEDKSSNLSGLEEWHIGLISFGILFVIFCCMFTVMILYFIRKRKLRTHPSLSLFPITFDNAGDLELHPISPQMPKKISRFSFKQFTSPVLTNLLDINKLKTMLDNYKSIEEEYSNLPGNTVTMEHIPAGAVHKNRYADILPNPRTRVALYLQNGVPNSDYINANYIRGYRAAVKQYIATQGPLTETIEDFWRLVWEQRCSTIVMLTNLVEGEKDKCCQYWPDENNGTLVSGDLIITLSRTEAKNNFLMTTLNVQHKDKAVSREITHYWFTSWPDHGVPESTIPVIAFIREVHKHQNEIPGPMLVHCSAGIGRTGVFISSHIGMKHLEENGEVDILKIVSMLRQDRGGMVQTISQYHFVYKLLYDYGCYLQRMSSSQLPRLQQQQLQMQNVSQGSLNDTSDTTTDHDHRDSQSSLII